MARRESVDIVPKQAVEALYRDFTADFAKLADCFFGDPRSLDRYVEMTSDPYLRLVKREPLYEALSRFNEGLGAPPAVMENIQSLRRDGNYVVLVWQHPYLAGGPFETFLKCATALLLCQRLNQRGDGHYIPVVWAETDFAGLDEVNRVVLPRGGDLVTERLDTDPRERPAVDVDTGEAYDALVARLRALLPETEHSAWLFSVLEKAKGRDLGEHFCRFMIEAFGAHGLVVATPALFRQQTATVIARAIENPEQTQRLIREGIERIRDRGYPTDYFDWDDPLDMLYQEGNVRRRLHYEGGAFRVEGTERTKSPQEVAKELKAYPERFSTGVLLSPIAQDYCLPCVAHVAGPGGVAFFSVQKALFDTLYVAFPQVAPQVSATFVDGAAEKAMKALGKSLVDLLARDPAAAGAKAPDDRAILKSLAGEVGTAFQGWREAAERRSRDLGDRARQVERVVRAEAEKVQAQAALGGEDRHTLQVFDGFANKARGVSEESERALKAFRDRLQAALKGKVERPQLERAKAALLAAADALAQAAKADGDPVIDALVRDLAPQLDRLAQDALLARDRAKATGAAPTIESLRTLLAPAGGLQEDTIWTIWFLHARGPKLLEDTLAHLDPFDFRHQVLYLDG